MQAPGVAARADEDGLERPGARGPVALAVITAQRDFGNRAVRKRARLKYTIDDRGIDWFTNPTSRAWVISVGINR